MTRLKQTNGMQPAQFCWWLQSCSWDCQAVKLQMGYLLCRAPWHIMFFALLHKEGGGGNTTCLFTEISFLHKGIWFRLCFCFGSNYFPNNTMIWETQYMVGIMYTSRMLCMRTHYFESTALGLRWPLYSTTSFMVQVNYILSLCCFLSYHTR